MEKKRLKSDRLISGNGKTQRGGFLGLAALTPTVINGLTKIFGGGKKRRIKRIVIKRPQQFLKRK